MNNISKELIFIVCFVIFTTFLVFTDVNKKPIETTKTNNQDYDVNKLFTKDGCDVYRFHDAGYPRYFVNCGNNQASISWNVGCGKGCTNNVSVQTSNSDK